MIIVPFTSCSTLFRAADIPEVNVTVKWEPGPSGHAVTGTITIKNK